MLTAIGSFSAKTLPKSYETGSVQGYNEFDEHELHGADYQVRGHVAVAGGGRGHGRRHRGDLQPERQRQPQRCHDQHVDSRDRGPHYPADTRDCQRRHHHDQPFRPVQL